MHFKILSKHTATVSASKAQKQTLNVQCCLNPSAHSIFFFQILGIINVAEADDTHDKERQAISKNDVVKKNRFVLTFLQL